MIIIARVVFCFVLMLVVGMRYFRMTPKENRLWEMYTLFISIGLVLVVLPQTFIENAKIVHFIDILGLIITVIGVLFYVVVKLLKGRKVEQKKH
ncbi:hypothetical protein NDS46_30835 (plasmid) [Paenibacillus thiaminolyticus]|uniref:hypothetical protein n=1 Tax=Paenibacillus thiaminolyticus TaxID=49283 RepID=UPI00232CF68C|nr:hypothetical protein [Paenibacillus thiaminolyticus]WCF11743.1 hypothetical protein NDS46_30835 [Paenibacillus thiaminolyticus]